LWVGEEEDERREFPIQAEAGSLRLEPSAKLATAREEKREVER
jgi:hypothetical protein